MKSNKNFSKIFYRLLIVLCLILFILCYYFGFRFIANNLAVSNDETTNTGKHTVALVAKSTTSNFWKSVFAGAEAAATEYNLTLTIDGPESEEDYESQNAMIAEAVENGAEVLIFSAIDYEGNAEAINQAAEQGVKIVVIDSDVDSDQVSYRIGTDNYTAGQMVGEAILDTNLTEIKVGIVNYDVNSANGQEREEGFRDAVAEDERVTIVDAINVLSFTEEARLQTKEMLAQHPEINVIVTFNEWTSLGVGYAIEDLGLADETYVVAFDCNAVNVGMLETGEVDALIVQNSYAMGYLGVEYAYNLLNGTSSNETDIDTSTTLITRENMYDEEYQRILFSFE